MGETRRTRIARDAKLRGDAMFDTDVPRVRLMRFTEFHPFQRRIDNG